MKRATIGIVWRGGTGPASVFPDTLPSAACLSPLQPKAESGDGGPDAKK